MAGREEPGLTLRYNDTIPWWAKVLPVGFSASKHFSDDSNHRLDSTSGRLIDDDRARTREAIMRDGGVN